MGTYFIIAEIFALALTAYVLYSKKELAIVYIPCIYFIHEIITPSFPAWTFYTAVTLLIFRAIISNPFFFRNNFFALALIFYFGFLMTKASDIDAIRPNLFSAFWYFISIPLLPSVFKKYDRQLLYNELVNVALIILILFASNVLLSSLLNFNPKAQYGITKGVLYGNLYAANFNVVPLALFLVLHNFLHNKKLIHLAAFLSSFFFILLSLRRSVMLLSAAGVISCFLILLNKKSILRLLSFVVGGALVVSLIVYNTPFFETFRERYEMRNLDERKLEEEGRFLEYEILYNDFFKYKHYSPWTGYELMNSKGNYGWGSIQRERMPAFEERTLHGDLPNIAHSGGLIAVALYILMIITAFWLAFKYIKYDRELLFVFLFGSLCFLVFTGTGRYIEVSAMVLLFSMLYLPLGNNEPEETAE